MSDIHCILIVTFFADTKTLFWQVFLAFEDGAPTSPACATASFADRLCAMANPGLSRSSVFRCIFSCEEMLFDKKGYSESNFFAKRHRAVRDKNIAICSKFLNLSHNLGLEHSILKGNPFIGTVVSKKIYVSMVYSIVCVECFIWKMFEYLYRSSPPGLLPCSCLRPMWRRTSSKTQPIRPFICSELRVFNGLLLYFNISLSNVTWYCIFKKNGA